MNGPGNLSSGRQLPDPSPQHASSKTTALKGASHAFQNNAPVPAPRPNALGPPRKVNNGALAAAASVSRDRSHSFSRSPSAARPIGHSRRTSEDSAPDGSHGRELDSGVVSQRLSQHLKSADQYQAGNKSIHLKPPDRPAMSTSRSRSPSFIAAALAASRSASASPNPRPATDTQQQAYHNPLTAKRQDNTGAQGTGSIADLNMTDTTSIPPTTALVSMFEKTRNDMDPVKKGNQPTQPSPQRPQPALRPMTPPRTISPPPNRGTSPQLTASNVAWEKANASPASDVDLRRDSPQEAYNERLESRNRAPTPPPTRGSRLDAIKTRNPESTAAQNKPRASTPPPKLASNIDTVIHSPQPRRTPSQRIIPSDETTELELEKVGKKPPPLVVKPKKLAELAAPPTANSVVSTGETGKSPVGPPKTSASMSSEDSFVSASSAPGLDSSAGSPPKDTELQQAPISADSAPKFNPQVRSSEPTAVNTPRRTPVPPPPRRAKASNMAVESLANATMAGILASSRAAPSAPPSPPARLSRQHTPQMRQTLRQQKSKSDDEASRPKHHKALGNRKKHAHHEGARRRWREEITMRERKRYEGVWASNRGRFVSLTISPNDKPRLTDEDELVVDVVVRDIWARSRLPFDELAEVWDLVDSRGQGVLDRSEFVVGMWLIDQRLRGRRIPQKVTDSVWGSARGYRIGGPKTKRK